MMNRFFTFCFLLAFSLVPSFGAGLRVLFIGDSVTDGGWGCSGGSAKASKDRNHWDLNHLYGHSYMMLCAADIESRYPYSGIVFLNRGISGDDTWRMLQRWQQDAIDTRPDVLSLLEGTNDVLYYLDSLQTDSISHSFSMEAWEKNYRSLLDSSMAANPALRIILATPFVAKVGRIGERSDYELREQLIDSMSVRIRDIAAEYDALLVDYNLMFRELLSDRSVPASHWIWDGIHPSAAGHRRMADLWLQTFVRFLHSKENSF